MNLKKRMPIGTTSSTGQKCPESGVWQVVGSPSTTAPISENAALFWESSNLEIDSICVAQSLINGR